MPAIRTQKLRDHPDDYSPGGVAEIRKLLSFPAGELTHARVNPGGVSRPSRVYPSSEWFYVLAGHGEIWDGAAEAGSGVIELLSGRLIRIAPATPFQYRADDDAPLDILLAVMPQWRPTYHGVLDVEGPWAPTGEHPGEADTRRDLVASAGSAGIAVYDIDHAQPDQAPDGSMVWALGSEAAGGIAICKLPPAHTSTPAMHRTVEEIWYVMSGQGEISRRQNTLDPFVDQLVPGTCVDIGLGLTFQFRCTGKELVMVLLTMPCWPGAQEADLQYQLRTW